MHRRNTLAIAHGVALAVLLGAVGPAGADPAAAKQANARGLALAKKKDYQGAMAEYRKAVALDPGYVLAHYNLACAASLAHDGETAWEEIAWVGNRASWDSVARAAIEKDKADPDLRWFFENATLGGVWEGQTQEPTDVLGVQSATPGLGGPDLAAAARLLSQAPGKHDEQCAPADDKQGRVFSVAVENPPGGIAVASLRDGVGLLQGGQIVARTEPLGCTAPGASADQIAAVTRISGSLLMSHMEGAVGVEKLRFVVVQYGNGGRTQWTQEVALFGLNGKKLVRVFEAPIASSDAAGRGQLSQTPLGDLIYEAPGETRKQVSRWNQASFKFTPLDETPRTKP